MKNFTSILFLSLAGLLLLARFAFDFNGVYGQDAFEYLRYTEELNHYWTGGPKPGSFFWPVLYPLIGSLFMFISPDASWALQLVSLLALIGIILYTKIILEEKTKNKFTIISYLTLFLLLCPFILRASFLCMSDMLASFFVFSCFAHARFYTATQKPLHFVFCLFLGTCAVFTRYVAVVILIIPIVTACLTFIKNFSIKSSIILLGCVLIAAGPHFYFNHSNYTGFLNHNLLTSWSPLHFFQTTFHTQNGVSAYTYPNIVMYFSTLFHPGYLLAGLVLLPLSIKQGIIKNEVLILISLIAYLSFLSGTPMQNQRFIIIAIPLLSLVCFDGYLNLTNKIPYKKLLTSAIALILLGISFYSFKLVHTRIQLEKSTLSYLSTTHPKKTLYTFDIDVALKGYHYTGTVISLWEKPITAFNKGDLVLFNEQKFSKQWEGHVLMKNWDFIKKTYQLNSLKEFDHNWTLYEIQ